MLRPLYSADDGQEPQVGAAPIPAAPPAPAPVAAPATPEPAPDEPLSPAELRRQLTEARREAARYRTQVREREQAEAEAQRAAMAEVERLRADYAAATERLACLEAELRGYRLRDAIGAAVEPAALPAAEGQDPAPNPLHGISARLAARLIDPAALEYGDDGRPRPASLRRALEALALEYPEIRPQPAAPAPAAGPRLPAQPPAGGGGARPNPAQQLISTRYTALPPNVTKR